jgi:hypothetical protein
MLILVNFFALGSVSEFSCSTDRMQESQINADPNPYIHNTKAESQEKHGVWDPMPELTITTSPYVHSRVDSNTFTMGNPMPGSTLSPSQGLRIWPLRSMLDQRGEN